MMCFATDFNYLLSFSSKSIKDLGTVFYRQLNRLVSFFNYTSSYKIDITNIS